MNPEPIDDRILGIAINMYRDAGGDLPWSVLPAVVQKAWIGLAADELRARIKA